MDTQCNSTSMEDIEDIEDLFNDLSDDVDVIRRRNRHNKNIVVPKVKKKFREVTQKLIELETKSYQSETSFLTGKNVNPEPEMSLLTEKTENPESDMCFLPGRNSIYIRTWGCAHNSSDSEYMAGLLASNGYRSLH